MKMRMFRSANLLFCLGLPVAMAVSYANVTLTSLDGDLQVTVFLPEGLDPDEDPSNFFYRSTRFDHGSMIGAIRRKSHDSNRKLERESSPKSHKIRHLASRTAVDMKGTTDNKIASNIHGQQHLHRLYGADMWRVPHDPLWPESGIGLASEFGIGDDGSFCNFRCGWHGVDNVTNGVLGYQSAKPGDPFLKIGVGKLIKGSCQTCDSTDDYKFNSPYVFATKPQWTFSQPSVNTIIMEHQETLNEYGYKLQKKISLERNVLLVESTLTNLGSHPFSTAWYSHHFFSCDGKPIGPGYSIDLGLKPTDDISDLYEEPATLSWSTPLQNYAKVQSTGETVLIEMEREIERGVRIKTEFIQDLSTKGTFTIRACGTSIVEDIAEFVDEPYDPISMYAFNLYLERTTISPEPQLFIHLESGQSKTWTQRLAISDNFDLEHVESIIPDQSYLTAMVALALPSHSFNNAKHLVGGFFLVFTLCLAVLVMKRRSNSRRQAYTQLLDTNS